MADFNALQAVINAYIKKNGVQAITGQILNGVLTGMVNALGKGFTVAGDAIPTTDPGTMTGPVAYIAHTAGTYEHFGNLVVDQGEVAMLIFNENTWTKNVLASLAAAATVDDQVGTPAVTTSFVDGVLTFDFRNMKGNPGQDGTDGVAAGFGTVSASVDANVGTPAVTVTESGPNTAKNFSFAFRNLKGETGVTSVVVTVDNTTGNPACTASLNAGVLTLAFTGIKGAQGDTGVSADYPITIANNLTTDDPTSALSAAMGVQLESEVSQLEHDLDEIKSPVKIVDITSAISSTFVGQKYPYYANGNLATAGAGNPIGYYVISEALLKTAIAVEGFLECNGNSPAAIAFYSSTTPIAQNYIKDFSVQHESTSGKWFRAEIPAEARLCLVINRVISQPGPTIKLITNDIISDVRNKVDGIITPSYVAREKINILTDTRTVVSTNKYINSSTGNAATPGSDASQTLYAFSLEGIEDAAVRVFVGQNTASPAVIAFYTGDTITSSGYLQSASVVAKIGVHYYEAVVPKNAKLLVIGNRGDSLNAPTADLYYNPNLPRLESVATDGYGLPTFQYKPFLYHFNPAGFQQGGGNVKVFASESREDIAMAARLGFEYIEANIQETSDGKNVVLHGQGGKFGTEVKSISESYTDAQIQAMDINSVSLDFIKQNIRFATDVAKYQSEILTLEEFCEVCKEYEIGMIAGVRQEESVTKTCMALMGNNMLVYNPPATIRNFFNGYVFRWFNTSGITPEQILADAEFYGPPYIACLGTTVINEFDNANKLDDFIKAMHEGHFLVAASYVTQQEARALLVRGFDLFSITYMVVNSFDANKETIDLDGDSSQFTTTGTITDNVVTLAEGQTITFGANDVVPLGKLELVVRFTGAINISYLSRVESFSGTDKEVHITWAALRRSTSVTITATASTTITEIVYKTSKC